MTGTLLNTRYNRVGGRNSYPFGAYILGDMEDKL